jgi:hypothetical protein
MPSSSLLRFEIERSLAASFPSALSPAPRTIREIRATGIASVDGLLEGGLPVGAISELTGPVSSGRTSLALAFLSQRTAEERVCAWIDVQDSFDPESAAASGVALQQLLWVRCRDVNANAKSRQKERPETRLDQALRATDLLLQAGGFAAIVLDLGGIAREYGNRIPAATWFRFRQAADRARCCLLVLGKTPYAQSSAAVVLECRRQNMETAGDTVLCGFEYAVERRRERFSPATPSARKPPRSTWTVPAAWHAKRLA